MLTGGRGLIGSALRRSLEARGDRVVEVRRPVVESSTTSSGVLLWDFRSEFPHLDALEHVDAVIHLAGAGIADARWTPDRKRMLVESRVRSTEALSVALERAQRSRAKPFLVASATGFYGHRPGETLDEASRGGSGFLADLARAWEGAAKNASGRTVHLRFGIVLGERGGAFRRMHWPFRLGLGAVLGSGRQHWSWIGLDDAVNAITHALDCPTLFGPVNVVTPKPIPNAEFSREIARGLGSQVWFRIPPSLVRGLFGPMGTELFLADTAAVPARLQSTGFSFLAPSIEAWMRQNVRAGGPK